MAIASVLISMLIRTKAIFDSNVLLASGIVLSGNSYNKVRMLFDFMQLAIISPQQLSMVTSVTLFAQR